MKPFLFVLSVLFAYCIGMFVARQTRAEGNHATNTPAIPATVFHGAQEAHHTLAHPAPQTRAHGRSHGTARQRPHSARSQRHAPTAGDYVVFAGTERYRELESTCEAYPGRCVRVGNTTIIQ